MTAAAIVACSAITSFDGLVGEAKDAATESSIVDGALIDALVVDGANVGEAGGDAAPGDAGNILACDAPGLLAYWSMEEGTGAAVV